MTVLGGARPMQGAVRTLPRTAARPIAGGQRRRVTRATRATRSSSRVRTLIGGVIVAFLIGLIYLAQTVHLTATNIAIDQAVSQRDDLYRQVQTLETNVLAWGTEPIVLEHAQRLGLDQLPTRVRLAVH